MSSLWWTTWFDDAISIMAASLAEIILVCLRRGSGEGVLPKGLFSQGQVGLIRIPKQAVAGKGSHELAKDGGVELRGHDDGKGLGSPSS